MKGISKGFNKYITICSFVVKEEEMQIGCPTDVKHVSHIGFDGSSGSSPSWMNKFDTGPDFQSSSIGAADSTLSPWTSQDSDNMGQQSTEAPPKPKKLRRKKKKSSTTSSPRAGGVKIKTSRKSKSKLVEGVKELSVH
ncbi:hypothetical protein Leryth_018718 [Lithospermum erythrorhizon]|nr:hypothetical protein Leryth_018718 [Lithospermum erythrorhizon]